MDLVNKRFGAISKGTITTEQIAIAANAIEQSLGI